MKFFFCGGSNTDYDSLPYISGNPHISGNFSDKRLTIEQLYPDIVSKHFDATYVNVSLTGSSNKRTIRQIFYEYDMEEFDLICIDFTPKVRTEFYNAEHKKWERMTIRGELDKKYKLSTLYYENFYNDEYGSLMEHIEYNIIKKYLKALNKPHLIMNSDKISKNKDLIFDINFIEYHYKFFHLTSIGHKQVAKEIIKYYENFL